MLGESPWSSSGSRHDDGWLASIAPISMTLTHPGKRQPYGAKELFRSTYEVVSVCVRQRSKYGANEVRPLAQGALSSKYMRSVVSEELRLLLTKQPDIQLRWDAPSVEQPLAEHFRHH